MEASQDFVPVLLLTADRPPELQDAGANQAINQVDNDLLQSEATKVMLIFFHHDGSSPQLLTKFCMYF